MTTVREGWVVFDGDGEPACVHCRSAGLAWATVGYLAGASQKCLQHIGYTCRRVRVTIETIEEVKS